MKLTKIVALKILHKLIELKAPLSKYEIKRAQQDIENYDFEKPEHILYLGEWRIIPLDEDGINLCYNLGGKEDLPIVREIMKRLAPEIKFEMIWCGRYSVQIPQ